MQIVVNTEFDYGQTIKLNSMGITIPAIVEHIEIHTESEKQKIYYHLRSAKEYNQNGITKPHYYGPVPEEDLISYQKLKYGMKE